MKTTPNKHYLRPGRSFLTPLWLLAILFGLQSAQANFTLPLYERFNYTNNEPLGATAGSAVTWEWGNSASGSSAHPNTNASLSYIGMPVDTSLVPTNYTNPAGLLANTGTGKVRGANFNNPVTNVTIYSSFLLNVRSLSVSISDRLLFGLGAATTGSGADGGAGVWLDPSGRLKVSKNSTTVAAANTTYPLVLSNTYLVVFRYKTNSTGLDQVDLWLNPGALGDDNNIPAPDLTTTNNANARTFNSMTFNGNAPQHVFYMDEIRVATNWSNVTPATSWAGNTYNVTGGGLGCAGDSFAIGLSGSDLGISYLVYTNGVISDISATGTGSAISFGLQTTTAAYTVLATNTADATVRWMSGNKAVSVLTPPTIISQPAPVSAATNSSVVFVVSVTGSALQYQWYRNGVGLANGGNISGVTTPVLIISPATSAEVATTNSGYYCIITNACGYTATSVTNPLALHAAGSIVWQGTPNNLWDISTTTNWTNSASIAVVFNPGDNVILDDTFQNSTLAMQSPYLSPGLISYVGSQPMIINGNGNITGSGSIFGLNSSLLINGTGMLLITNAANSFAGGTTISNGTLSVGNFNYPVGTGPVTLAGGTFRVSVASTGSTSLSNNILVATSSTLEYDGTGGNAFNFAGTLTGVAGQTLTIFNNQIGSTFNWLRLLKGFTNDANIVLTSPFASVDITPVLSGGDQVFNGTISGTVGRFRVTTGNNSVIFNAQNTYNDSASANNTGISLYMTGGNAGFGADSVSSSPPTIDASPAGTGNIGIGVASGEGGNCGLFASGGAHTVGNPIIYPSATNTFMVSIIGNHPLTLSGTITLSGADGTGNTNRTFSVTNTALATFSGVISDGGLNCGLIKTGNGTLDLNGASTYAGQTIVSNGILAGTGSIVSPVTVAAAGSIGAGTASVGTLTINNSLTLNGNGFFKLNKSVSPSNDVVSVSGALTSSGTGIITVTNIGVPAIAAGDKFKLFNKAVANGATLAVTGGGVIWTNKLGVDGSIEVLSAIPTYSTNLHCSFAGGVLTVQWPQTHLGWVLQYQTNALNVGLNPATNWHDVVNSGIVTSTNFPVSQTNPIVYYRMRYP